MSSFFERFVVFNKEALGSVKAIEDKEGNVWFLGTEVASKLGYKNLADAIIYHVNAKDTKSIYKRDYAGTQIETLWQGKDRSTKTLINESGMNALILGSKLPMAEEFKHWITNEVLPAIRKDGGYIAGQELLPQEEGKAVIRENKARSEDVAKTLARRTKYWHEAVAARNDLKADNIILRKEARACRKDADVWFERYQKLIDEAADLTCEVIALKEQLAEYETLYGKKQKTDDQRITVDAAGFLV